MATISQTDTKADVPGNTACLICTDWLDPKQEAYAIDRIYYSKEDENWLDFGRGWVPTHADCLRQAIGLAIRERVEQTQD